MPLARMDHRLIHFFRTISVPVARLALFTVFFWFGLLKILDLSPATELVSSLHDQLVSFIPFSYFYLLFSVFECLIGILFLIKGAERIVLPLLFLHLFATVLPLILLPTITWNGPFVPTLEGQYIIKNLLILATAIGLAAHLHPLPKKL